MTEAIDDTIVKVESLYRSLTGREVPELKNPHAPIPAESDPIEHVQEAMDRLAQLLADGGTSQRPNANPAAQNWIPTLSLWESAEEVLVAIDLPGVKRQGLELTVQGNLLMVSGRRTPAEANGTKFSLVRAENATGTFRRAIPLPGQMKTEQATATLQEGVLTVRIPREVVTQTAPRPVPIA
ncbi:MAG TPA: Hsp20/alpha crystallin family protein [Polyangiaceae bacterium]|nr:Hsp20/alpha crystallin family protein [Polyangiaceae bacterium]